MDHRAACDSAFLDDHALDYEVFFDTWAPFVERVLNRCTVWIDERCWEATGRPGSLIHEATRLPFKEIRSFVLRAISRMELSREARCDGRAEPAHCFSIRYGEPASDSLTCGDDTVMISHGCADREFQEFWRSLLEHHAGSGVEFDRFVDVAFPDLEWGPEGRGKWEETGHAFLSVRRRFVIHLSYLNDQAWADYEASGFHDGNFARVAVGSGVELSRDAAQDKDRRYVDASGSLRACPHHTKLSPEGTARSARHGGRIYFGMERGKPVFVGKVTDHD